MRRAAAALALLLAMALLAGCGSDRHTGRGVVRDMQRGNGQVVIEHGDIEGLMPAMTMNFEVPDPELLASLQRGQVIDFTVHFTGKSYRVVEATVVGEDAGVGGAFPDVVSPRDTAPGFALTDSGTMEFGGMAANVYHFVGQDRRLPEPEKTVMFVIGSPEALITVEAIAPTSKLDLLRLMQIISGATFKWPAG